jgi:hypothetical protein
VIVYRLATLVYNVTSLKRLQTVIRCDTFGCKLILVIHLIPSEPFRVSPLLLLTHALRTFLHEAQAMSHGGMNNK